MVDHIRFAYHIRILEYNAYCATNTAQFGFVDGMYSYTIHTHTHQLHMITMIIITKDTSTKETKTHIPTTIIPALIIAVVWLLFCSLYRLFFLPKFDQCIENANVCECISLSLSLTLSSHSLCGCLSRAFYSNFPVIFILLLALPFCSSSTKPF